MSKYNISCFSMDLINKCREWEITPEGRVWPCCNFSNAWDKRHMEDKEEFLALSEDPIMKKLINEDPNWNHLEHYTLEEIVNHKIYQTYIFKEGWESDNPPLLCKNNCSNCSANS